MRPGQKRHGVTLVELLVVLAILGIMSAVPILAFTRRPGSRTTTRAERLDSLLAEARRESLRTGKPISLVIDDSAGARLAAVLPDGSIIADSALTALLALDRLSGRSHRSAHASRSSDAESRER